VKNLTWQNPEQLFVAQVLINKVKSKCCGIKGSYKKAAYLCSTCLVKRKSMSEVQPYKLPEEKTSIVSDSMAVRITPDTDIATLRHNVMDAVYATSDQNALYSCLVFLSNQKQTLQSSVKEELLNRLDELSKLPDGWDGEGSLALSRNIVDFVKRIILLAADSSLQDWVAFPDARGYIYLDYTEDNNIAGVTISNHQVVAFIKRNGHLSKFSFDKLDEKEVLSLLEKVHG
jgi:hypothetical protein